MNIMQQISNARGDAGRSMEQFNYAGRGRQAKEQRREEVGRGDHDALACQQPGVCFCNT